MTFFQKIFYRLSFKLNILSNIRKSIARYIKYKDTLILVYSPGQTGSSTVYYTLMKEFPLNKVLHVHFLSDYWIKEKLPKDNYNMKNDKNKLLADKVYKALKKKKKVKIISLIRDPFSRGISAYFHNPILRNQVKDKDMETIRRGMLNYSKDDSLFWYETDFNNFLNCNVFEDSFDKKRGAKRIDLSDNIEVLLLKTNQLSKNGKKEIEDFLDISIDELIDVNQREKDTTGEIYKQIKNYYFEEPALFNEKINSQFTQHFFSDSELKSFKEKYLDNFPRD